MTIPRVNPTGWPINGTLTTAQMNALDVNLAKCVDKTTESLTANTITWASSSTQAFLTGAAIQVHGGAFTGASGLAGVIYWQNAGITVTSTGRLDFTAGGSLVITGGGSLLKTLSSGRIVLNDPDLDYVEFSEPRTFTRIIDIVQTGTISATGGGFTLTSDGARGPSGSTPATAYVPIQIAHNGSTLTSIELLFTVGTSHTALPASNVAVSLLRRAIQSNEPIADYETIATAEYTPATPPHLPTDPSIYNNGAAKSLVLTLPANTAIDNAAFVYTLAISEESGTGAIGQTVFHSATLNYSLADMRFC